MFLDFAGMMINTNYIISIYKSVDYYNENNLNKLLKSQTITIICNNITETCVYKEYSQTITIICNNITETCVYKEYYNNEKERNKRFDELNSKLNNK